MLVAKKENKSFFFAMVVKLKRQTCIANDNEKLIPDGYIEFKENRLGNDSEKESKLILFQCLWKKCVVAITAWVHS